MDPKHRMSASIAANLCCTSKLIPNVSPNWNSEARDVDCNADSWRKIRLELSESESVRCITKLSPKILPVVEMLSMSATSFRAQMAGSSVRAAKQTA